MKAKRMICMCLLALALVAGSAACTPDTPMTNEQPATSTAPLPPTPATSESTADNSYSYGYGTYYVAARRSVPPGWGNAKTWYAHAQAAGYRVGDTPEDGAIAWTDKGPFGQVAIVEEVSADGMHVTISEMNGKGGGFDQVTTRTAPASSFKYIYIF